MSSPATLVAQRTAGVARALTTARPDALTRASLTVKDALLAQGRADAGADLRLSNAGRAKLRVKFTVKGDQSIITPAGGPWGLLEHGARPHLITPRRRNRSGVLAFGGRFARSVRHPGSPARRTWSTGRKQSERKAAETLRREFLDAARRGWGR